MLQQRVWGCAGGRRSGKLIIGAAGSALRGAKQVRCRKRVVATTGNNPAIAHEDYFYATARDAVADSDDAKRLTTKNWSISELCESMCQSDDQRADFTDIAPLPVQKGKGKRRQRARGGNARARQVRGPTSWKREIAGGSDDSVLRNADSDLMARRRGAVKAIIPHHRYSGHLQSRPASRAFQTQRHHHP